MKEYLPIAKAAELIVVSPMRRTLQTLQEGVGWLLDEGVPVQPRGEWQENSDKPCDTGTSTKILAQEYPTLDFSTVFPEYPSKEGRWEFSESAIIQRGMDCRRWLRARSEKVIIVISHSAFLRTAITPTRYENADYRVFDFAETGDHLVQWSLTEDNGGGMGRSPKGPYYRKPADFTHENFDKERKQPQASGEPAKEIPT